MDAAREAAQKQAEAAKQSNTPARHAAASASTAASSATGKAQPSNGELAHTGADMTASLLALGRAVQVLLSVAKKTGKHQDRW